MKWAAWRNLKLEDRIELVRSQMSVERSTVNVLFWFAITFALGLSSWPLFAFVPGAATALSAWSLSKSWKANNATIRKIREGGNGK